MADTVLRRRREYARRTRRAESKRDHNKERESTIARAMNREREVGRDGRSEEGRNGATGENPGRDSRFRGSAESNLCRKQSRGGIGNKLREQTRRILCSSDQRPAGTKGFRWGWS
ncbi:hypothetical protein C8Q80DRAFT_145081 [Daedaleopsis nitida]|nr:hypothetical protein C8Q80DRAFT_145081 [Daedaleopsis nitida]